MTTFSDLYTKVQTRLLSGTREQFVTLQSDVDAGDEVLSVAGPGLPSIVPGMRLSCDLEMYLVLGATSGGSLTVMPAQEGSLPGSHEAGTKVIVNPRFPLFECARAINDDLADLSSPSNGLGQVLTVDFTYNPVYVGYDLGTAFTSTSKVLEVSAKYPPPNNSFPLIKRGIFKVVRNSVDPAFPSGNGIVIRKSGFPGLPIHVQFLAPYTPLDDPDDDVAAVAGLSPYLADLPALGAQILLVQPREVKRNATEFQGDARKAPEVPPGAIMASTNALSRQRQMRIDSEADRLFRAFPEAEDF